MLGWFLDLLSLLYYDAVDRIANDQVEIIDCPHMQNYFMLHKVFIVWKLNNKQNAKVICRLRTAHNNRQTKDVIIGNLSSAHAFDCIVATHWQCLVKSQTNN